MKKSFVVACLQMTSVDDVNDNLVRAGALIAQAVAGGARLVVLPEFFGCLSADETAKLAVAETDNDGPMQHFLADMARQYDIYLVGGTVPIISEIPSKVYSLCPLYAPNGNRIACYKKMHLFRYRGSSDIYDEAKTILPGNEIVGVDTPLGRIGLSVCYDLRFPELYRGMGKPNIIIAPSAFVPETGQMHWELLLRARAVENLAYVLGAAQSGIHSGGRRTYGNTMIVNPKGEITSRTPADGDDVVLAVVDSNEQQIWRQRLPALDNRRL